MLGLENKCLERIVISCANVRSQGMVVEEDPSPLEVRVHPGKGGGVYSCTDCQRVAKSTMDGGGLVDRRVSALHAFLSRSFFSHVERSCDIILPSP